MLTGLVVLLSACFLVLQHQRHATALAAAERETTKRIASAARAGEALAVELALRWRDGIEDHAVETRRALQRAQLLAGWMDWSAADVAVARLVLALPGKTAQDRRLGVPPHVREIAARRGEADPGGVLPPAAQLVGMVDFLEAWQGREATDIRDALEGEAGARFDARLVHIVLAHLIELDETGARDDAPVQGITGAVICIHPLLPEDLGSFEVAPLLRRLEEKVRERLRPSDRVYATDRDVVAWLPHAAEPDTARVVERLVVALDEVVLPGRHWGPLHCRVGSAQAGADGDRLPELVVAARRRIAEVRPVKQVA